MYRFVDTVKQKCLDEYFKPISAMSYANEYLEDIIDGYQTLSVDGRETLNVEFSADNFKYGTKISYQRLPPRILTVKYKIESKDPYDILIQYRKLMNFLYREENAKIIFNDEEDIYYEGRFQGSSDVPGNVMSFVSEFTVYCESPLKRTVKSFKTGGLIGAETPFETKPIIITCKAVSSNQMTIKNGRETITLRDGTIKANDVIVFDFEKGVCFLNGTRRTDVLELSSDFENFELKQGDRIISNNGTLEIMYKGVSL